MEFVAKFQAQIGDGGDFEIAAEDAGGLERLAAEEQLKEAGLWTDAAQQHNEALFKRQRVLADAWKAYLATNPADESFADGWRKARAR